MSDTALVIVSVTGGFAASYLVFLLGQLTLKWVIEPLHDFQTLLGRIEFSLDFYSDLIFNPSSGPSEDHKDASRNIRQLAMALRTDNQRIRFYWFFRLFHLVPPNDNIPTASKALVGLSNGTFATEGMSGRIIDFNREKIQEVKKLLRLQE